MLSLKPLALASLLLGAVPVLAPATAAADTLWLNETQDISRAVRALKAGEVDRAIAFGERGVRQATRPATRVEGLVTLCAAYPFAGEHAKAIAACDEAAALAPRDWRVFNNRGNARLDAGDFKGAVADYERALALNPKARTVRTNLAIASSSQDRLMSAEAVSR